MLAGSRKEVVIKVLRPGTEDVLLTDLNFVSTVMSQVNRAGVLEACIILTQLVALGCLLFQGCD